MSVPSSSLSAIDRPPLTYSDSESQRFGLRVFRAVWPDVSPGDLVSQVLEHRADMTFLRVPSDRFQPRRMDETGLPYLVADTLVYYHCNLSQHEPQSLKTSDLEFVEAGPEHGPVLEHLVDACFVDYTNHYASSPYLRREDWLTGYKEWALGYAKQSQTRRCFLARLNGQVVAFATCSFDDTTCEGVLYGVAPEAAGKGLYGDLIRFTQRYFKDRGCTLMKVSTQIQNFAVQKAWVREGFRLVESYVTLHVNSFLSRALEPVTRKVWRQESAPISPWQEMMDHHARSFPKERWLSASGRQFLPLRAGAGYVLTCTVTAQAESGRAVQTLTQVVDSNGELCFLGYCQLVEA